MSLETQAEKAPAWGYLVLRLCLGVNFFMHGMVRLFGDYDGFVEHITSLFRDTFLPYWLLSGYAHAVPVVEAATGLLLLLGLFTLPTLVVCGGLMMSFQFGTALIQNWSLLGSQLIYVAIFYFLLRDIGHNRFSLDHALASRR